MYSSQSSYLQKLVCEEYSQDTTQSVIRLWFNDKEAKILPAYPPHSNMIVQPSYGQGNTVVVDGLTLVGSVLA